MTDLFQIAENLSNINPTQIMQKLLSRNDIQKLMIELNTENQLGELNENKFSIKLSSTKGGNYSVGYAKSKGVSPSAIDLKKTGKYWKTFKVVPLANGNANIISDNTIHGSKTFLAKGRWGEVEGLNKVNTLIVLNAIDEAILEIILQ